MRKSPPPIGMGLTTIITVLLVLTLSVFSSLTLTSARADLALSQRNADTVFAYYRADGEAAAAYAAFAAGTDPTLETTIPMTETQCLRLHLARENGRVRILVWQTVPAEDTALTEDLLPVWGGSENPQ